VSPATVLITDDDPDIRFLLASILRSAEFDVVEAQNGRDALSRLAAEQLPDIVILDVQMPEMDGWETLSTIRADPRTAWLPVILCTVKSTPENVARAWKLGADDYATKPFDATELVDQIRLVLARDSGERDEARHVGLAQASAGLSEDELIKLAQPRS
jgi:two-component system, OmpR family, response regulator